MYMFSGERFPIPRIFRLGLADSLDFKVTLQYGVDGRDKFPISFVCNDAAVFIHRNTPHDCRANLASKGLSFIGISVGVVHVVTI